VERQRQGLREIDTWDIPVPHVEALSRLDTTLIIGTLANWAISEARVIQSVANVTSSGITSLTADFPTITSEHWLAVNTDLFIDIPAIEAEPTVGHHLEVGVASRGRPLAEVSYRTCQFKGVWGILSPCLGWPWGNLDKARDACKGGESTD